MDTGTGFAYGTCDAACVRTACELAIAGMFDRAASSSPSLPLDIAHSGRATTIDDAAHPLRIEGSWVGTTTLTGSSVTLGGTALTGASP